MAKETDNNDYVFGWENPSDDFIQNTSGSEVIKNVEEDNLEEEIKKPSGKKGEEAEEEEEEPAYKFGFESSEEEEEEDEDNDEFKDINNPVVTTKVTSKSTLEFLKEKGLVDYELEEGTELTDELAEQILEDNYEDSIEAAAEEKIKDLPDALKQMIKVAMNGGDYLQAFAALAKSSVTGITKDLDMENEDNQALVVAQDLREQEYDEEYIETHIQTLKDSGKLKGIADKLFTKAISKSEKEAAAIAKAAADKKEQDKKNQREYKTNITTQVSTLKDIKGIVLNKQDKEELPSYMADPTVKMTDGRTITKFQQELFAIFGDKEKSILLAKLVKSDFDFSSVARAVETKNARELKDEVTNNKREVQGSGGSSQKKSKKFLADLLD